MRLPPSQQSITPDKLAEKTVTSQSTQEVVGGQQKQQQAPAREDVDKMQQLLDKKDNDSKHTAAQDNTTQKSYQKSTPHQAKSSLPEKQDTTFQSGQQQHTQKTDQQAAPAQSHTLKHTSEQQTQDAPMLQREIDARRTQARNQDPLLSAAEMSQTPQAQQASHTQQAQQTPQAHPTQAAEQSQNAAQLPKNIHDVAEKILVQQNQARGESRVQITVNRGILPNTEIQLQNTHGQLNVVIATSSPHAHETLSQHMTGLQNYLNQNGRQDQTVNVRLDYKEGIENQQDGNQQESEQRQRAEDYYREQQ